MRIKTADSVLHESSIYTPQHAEISVVNPKTLLQACAKPPIEIDWPFMERIISMNFLLHSRYDQSGPNLFGVVRSELLFQMQ